MAIVDLEKDIKIRTFSPRHGFDPLTASPRYLEEAGFRLVEDPRCWHVRSTFQSDEGKISSD